MGLTAAARRRAEGDTLKYFVEDPGTGTLYKRGQLLGQGAFGQCYKFTDTSTNRVYAVKVLSQQRVARLGNRGKVQREIELHSQLHHRNVVGFHRHFADQENIYLVLEYCSRKSLAHILKIRRTLTEPEVRFYLKQITSGLQYLHQQGIIHRDLKLSNVFITKCMQVKIGDLGLATREERAYWRRGVVCGTPNYLAPEVIAKKGHSFKSDIWALGCIMYTALAGFPPFEITHKQELFQRIQEGCYPLLGHLSPAACSLIGRLLAPDPSGRPSLEEVLGHPFFTQHFIPARLPSRACRSAPIFPFANPLGKFFQKAAMLLFRGAPCQGPQAVSPAPQEQEETPQLQGEGPVAPPHLEEAKEGSTDPMEEPSCLSPLLLQRGSLHSRLPEGEFLPRPHQDCAQPLSRRRGPLDLRGPPTLQHHLPSGHPGTAGLDAAPTRTDAIRPALAALPLAAAPLPTPTPVQLASQGPALLAMTSAGGPGCPREGLYGSPSFQGPQAAHVGLPQQPSCGAGQPSQERSSGPNSQATSVGKRGAELGLPLLYQHLPPKGLWLGMVP